MVWSRKCRQEQWRHWILLHDGWEFSAMIRSQLKPLTPQMLVVGRMTSARWFWRLSNRTLDLKIRGSSQDRTAIVMKNYFDAWNQSTRWCPFNLASFTSTCWARSASEKIFRWNAKSRDTIDAFIMRKTKKHRKSSNGLTTNGFEV